jgi:hypothetical protein
MYGSTFIHGRTITTGKIQSVDGSTWFDLDAGEIKGKIEFTEDSPAFAQVTSGGENLLYPKDEYFEFIPNIERYFDKNLQYVFSVDIDNSAYNLPEATMILIGKKGSSYLPIAEKKLSFQSSNNTGISRANISFTAKINDYKSIFCKVVGSSNADFPISNAKLETGALASDYSTSQYYLEKRIEEVEAGANWYKTTISGNIITTGTLLLGNYETGTNAGITGIGTENDVFLWGGSTFSNRDTAPIRFYRNGTGYLSNVTVKGNIIAESGSIGIGDKALEIFHDNYLAGVRTKDAFLVFGDYANGEDFLQLYRPNNNSPSILIDATKSNANAKSGITINVSGSTTSNSALTILNGDIRVNSSSGMKTGISGSFQVGNLRLTFEKGIIIKNEIV